MIRLMRAVGNFVFTGDGSIAVVVVVVVVVEPKGTEWPAGLDDLPLPPLSSAASNAVCDATAAAAAAAAALRGGIEFRTWVSADVCTE